VAPGDLNVVTLANVCLASRLLALNKGDTATAEVHRDDRRACLMVPRAASDLLTRP
jgi:hypothetical protein